MYMCVCILKQRTGQALAIISVHIYTYDSSLFCGRTLRREDGGGQGQSGGATLDEEKTRQDKQASEPVLRRLGCRARLARACQAKRRSKRGRLRPVCFFFFSLAKRGQKRKEKKKDSQAQGANRAGPELCKARPDQLLCLSRLGVVNCSRWWWWWQSRWAMCWEDTYIHTYSVCVCIVLDSWICSSFMCKYIYLIVVGVVEDFKEQEEG